MRTKFIIICGLLALVSFCAARPAEEEYEYEEEPAPPPKRVPARPLVSRGSQALKNKKGPSTSTTTTAAPQEEAEEAAEGDYADEQPETSSTTEAPKRVIKTGIIRPFRSNDDLLATLKRRREDAISNKQFKPAVQKDQNDESASEPVQKESKPAASLGRKSKFNKSNKSTANEVPTEQSSSTTAPARTSRGRFGSRS